MNAFHQAIGEGAHWLRPKTSSVSYRIAALARVLGVSLLLGVACVFSIRTALGQVPEHGLLREVWEGIPGLTVADLMSSPDYPDHPSSSNYVTGLFESPTDVLEQYGQRMHGYLVPPLTGNYTFWIATDDGGSLYLSTDENPANVRLIASVIGWTPPRQWDVESNQRSAPIPLVAGKVYYVSAFMKEEGGGDNLAVRWLMPDGNDQAPVDATNCLPYGISFAAPVIAQHPTNTSAVEGESARFAVKLSAVGIYGFQWQRNQSPIAGATGPELVVSPVWMSDSGAKFRCVITNKLGAVTSSEAVLTVTPDTVPPRLLGAQNIGNAQLEAIFSESVAAPSATTVANYQISPGIGVIAAAFGASPSVIILTTTPMTISSNYTLTVNEVRDLAAIPNTISPNTQLQFTAVEYAPLDIGNPPLAGYSTPDASGGMDVSGSGAIGGTADTLQFAWQQWAGDFDVRARLAAFDPTDPFAKAGLMMRESLTAASRCAAVLATPATVGCFFLARTVTGGSATQSGFFPANYPAAWLRLKRAGNTFSGYASYDGQTWIQLGSSTMNLPSVLYFGLAASSRNSTRLATAAFRDIGTVSSATVAAYVPRGESVGPSSRMSPLVFTEIMYHPKEHPDGKDGEFIELYNADLIPQDFTGHYISGSVQYAFPDGTVLPAGGVAIIARNPIDFGEIYGRPGALGPFAAANSLPDNTGTIRLCNPQGAILLEVIYNSKPPWPAAPNGAGPSLVLARPSYGEGDSRAWAASGLVGGSPGQMEAVRTNPYATVLINEFLARTSDPQRDFIELYNHSTQPVNISGCVITDDPATNRFRIPEGTILTPQGFAAFDQDQLGFGIDASGETLYLISPDLSRVIDAVRFGPQEAGVASGRFPDGAPEIRRLMQSTPNAENASILLSEIAINEIMFNPISGDSADEFVELYNRTSEPVDLSGWHFTDGIDFTFPEGTILNGAGYLVVAKDRDRLLSNHPALNASQVAGGYDGALANGGERIALAKPGFVIATNQFGLLITNRTSIDVDEVTYGKGGRWGQWSDGLGSSLELIDPNSDHLRPSNWADSDESSKSVWSTIEITGRLDNGDGDAIDRLQIMLQGAGECLVDNIEASGSDGANRLANPGFESGLNPWTIQGNHRDSSLESGSGVSGSHGLHVRSSSRGDTAANRIYAPINPPLAVNSTATLRAKVRWLKGWPEFMLRTRGSYLEAAGRMAVPANLGTPGTRNSRAVANAGPAIFTVSHSPVLPSANQAVLVTARVTDPQGIAQVRLRYRLDPSSTATTIAMTDDGFSGDEVAGDGVYSGRLPGQSSGALIAFYVEATDAPNTGAVATTFPAKAPEFECLVRWGESQPVGNLGVYRLWQRQSDYNWLRSREPLANDNIDCTFVYNDGRVIYNASMRAKGSPWHGGSTGGDYVLACPDDDRFLGERDLALVTVGNLGNDDSAQREQAAFWIGRQLGIPTLHRRHVLFYENGERKQNVYEDTQEPNGYYADRWWPNGQDGDLYKIEDWFEFNDRGDSFTFNRDATLEKFTTIAGAYKLARYRWAWRKRAVVDSANNYTNFFNLLTAANLSGASLVQQFNNIADVEVWMREFALQHIVGNWDAYGYSRGKNSYIYKPLNDRFKMIPWDIDFVLGSGGDGPTSDIFSANDPTITRLWDTPAFRRVYLRAFLDAINGPLQSANFDPVVDARYAALAANGISVASASAIKTWVSQRRAYLANRIVSMNTSTFAITSNGGADINTSQPQATLTGSAPLAVKTIEVNGIDFPLTWSTPLTWSLTIPLAAATNTLRLAGYDTSHKLVSGATDSITVNYTGSQLPSPADFLVINEIMYNPRQPNASFLEIYNTSTTASFDLSQWRLEGVGFTFPNGVVLGPGACAVVAKNRDAFAAAYGFGILPIGEFPGSLRNDGERLKLIRPGIAPEEDLIVDQVRYEGSSPWPEPANGLGPSLQLIDPRQDNWTVGNWAAANTNSTVLATPGFANSVVATLPGFPPVVINEIQPENRQGLKDHFGDRDPWIELHNAGTNTIDLSGWSLTPDYQNLSAWTFPNETAIGPKGFLLVWADGEESESSPGELHANFRLTPTNGSIALVRQQLGRPAITDYINYVNQPAGLSFGSYPDGQPQERRLFHLPTPSAPNDPGIPATPVFINEWMASNTGIVLDPADNDADDWFEIYNAGSSQVDLSAFTLSDDPANKTPYVIPNGTVIPANGFLFVWADEEGTQSTNGQLHANFKLSGNGDAIGLFAPAGESVDLVRFGPQTNNVSQGRFPDAMEEPFLFFEIPTPAQPNVFAAANQPPVLGPIGNRAVDEGQIVLFTAAAADPDPGQQLVFSLADAPANATIDPNSGAFSWQTTEADGPGEFAFLVRVSDNGIPIRSDTETIIVAVREVNRPPVLNTIGDMSVDEGTTLHFTVSASDPDEPAQILRFSLEPGAPAGAAINALTGEFTWTPSEDQGFQNYSFAVRVDDNATPPLAATQIFQITVNEIDNPPVFAPVGLQIIDELSAFQIQLAASDPDTPPRSILYTLETSPSGIVLDSNTGLLAWTPAEMQGPNSYNIVVRASEIGGTQSSTHAFSIVVNEKNTPPVLASIPDFIVGEGTAITFTNSASDTDLPAQRLVFRLDPGAPAGASVDPQTGVFTWFIGPDAGSSTNRITVRVADDALDTQSATRSFTVVVVAQPKIVINEIMYHPKAVNAEFIELHNWSTNTSWPLAGWRLTGTEFTFPSGTILPAGGFLVVSRNMAGFRTAYGTAVPAVGDYTNSLGSVGGTIQLLRPAGDTEEMIDSVSFSANPPWPPLANGGGPSLQLLDPRQDNARVANWAAVSGASTNAPRNVIPMEAAWRFWQQTGDPTPGWTNRVYDDSSWPSGAALLYAENASMPVPKRTPLTIGPMSYFFRTRFSFDGNPEGASLQLNTVIDDGAVFYLNGREFFRLGMNETEVIQRDTPSSRTVSDAALEGPFAISVTNLQNGENVLAVEVHQTNPNSTDIVYGMSADVIEVKRESFTPGYANSVRTILEPFPPVWINEVLPNNLSGLLDSTGDHDPWLELANSGETSVSLDGYFLASNLSDLRQWPFPGGSVLAANGYTIVWADAEPLESTAAEWHANFRLSSPSGIVVLARLQNGQPVVVDYLDYLDLSGDQAFGYLEPRQPGIGPAPLDVSTPGGPNTAEPPSAPQILEFEANAEGRVSLSWSATTGRVYRIEAALTLEQPAWQTQGQVIAQGPVATFTTTLNPGQSRLFYRVATP